VLGEERVSHNTVCADWPWCLHEFNHVLITGQVVHLQAYISMHVYCVPIVRLMEEN
jgi:hypothetical protein